MIATQEVSASRVQTSEWLERYAPALLIVTGLLVRMWSAEAKFLNADEAMHYLLALQPFLKDAYQASLGTAHPPLLIVLLHYWQMIAGGEFFLRLPSVLAGTAAGWFLYAWTRDVTDRTTGMIALALFLFSPALIYTSAEVRQYALVFFFMSAALYFLERAIIRDSSAAMLASAIALYLALLTHYCALICAATIGIYGLLRFAPQRPGAKLASTWIGAQVGAAAIAWFLWKTHISVIRHTPLTQDVAESYLRNSLFHPHQENALMFVARANVRLFHFLFSHGAISIVGLLLFVAGLALLLKQGGTAVGRRATARQLGILLLLPFALNCVAALAGIYPYGGTRHNSYLAIFAMPAISVALAHWRPARAWTRPLVIGAALAVCNLTVTPAGAYIKPNNQKRKLMGTAVQDLRTSAPSGSVILTDYESGLLLSYYLCGKDITHPGEPSGYFYHSQCGSYESASLLPRLWVFRAESFPAQLADVVENISTDRQVWLFQAGFVVDREPDFQAHLAEYGCSSPQKFGANVLVCKIQLQRAK